MRRVVTLIAPIHRWLRSQKCDLFFSALRPRPADSLLDIGGGAGISGEFARVYRFFSAVHVVNLDPRTVSDCFFDHVTFGIADGCALPFPDRSFDWVFSNAVIEHVGGLARQESFAAEIRRVARRGYFVATPDIRFPVAPHTLLPFYQFFSPRWQRRICRFSPGYLRSYERIDLLSARDLTVLFPQATVRRMGFPLFPNNLVAYRALPAS